MIREAEEKDLERIRELRKEVHALHVKGEPQVFNPEFSEGLVKLANKFVKDNDKQLLVYEEDGKICGYAMIEFVEKEESIYRKYTKYLEVGELGVDSNCRSKGIGKKLMSHIENIAKQKQVDEIQLNMWEFNQRALNFYERSGYETFRRYLRLRIK